MNRPVSEKVWSRAVKDLDCHRGKLVELFGQNYSDNPEYHAVVRKVAIDGRVPFYALLDQPKKG